MLRKAEQRNQGIDCLRSLAMLGIVLQHLMGHGGLTRDLSLVEMGVGRYSLLWIVLLIVYTAVDCYALISGYVGYSDESTLNFKVKRFVQLWLQVFFYSVVINILVQVGSDSSMSWGSVVKSALPLTFNQYWYYSAYAGLFFIMPFINKMISNLSKRETYLLIVICIGVFSVYGGFLGKITDPFSLQNGSSTLWLCILYIVGGCTKKLQLHSLISRKKCIIVYLILFLVCFISVVAIPLVSRMFLNSERGRGLFVSYSSPMITIMALMILVYFSQFKIPDGINSFNLSYIAPSSFGIYLIHDHPMIRERFIADKLTPMNDFNPFVEIGALVLFAICVFALSAIVELLRRKLFQLLKVENGIKEIIITLSRILKNRIV